MQCECVQRLTLVRLPGQPVAPAPAAVLPATGAAPGRAEPANGGLVSPSAAHVRRAYYREGGESPLPEADARGSAEKGQK